MSVECKHDKAIVAASFGTSFPDVLKKTIEACENDIARAFPEYTVFRVFTSNMIRKKIEKRDGIHIDNLEESLNKLKQEGTEEVVIQPLHMIPGEEYHEKILKPVRRFWDQFNKLAVGGPVLTDREDYDYFIEALRHQLPPMKGGKAVVLMGHGTGHPANASYSMLQLMLLDIIPNVFIANVEGYPELEDVLPRLKASGIRELLLMPMMLVAGDHAQNDTAGDGEDSWVNVLSDHGFLVSTFMHGLGENAEFRKIYLEHIKKVQKISS